MRLRYYVMRRLLSSFVTLILVILAAFLVVYIGVYRLSSSIQSSFGFNGPLPYVFYHFLVNVLSGNWGINTASTLYAQKPITWIVSLLLPYSLQLIVATLLLSLLVTIPVGTHIAFRRNSGRDYAARLMSFIAYGTPILFSAYLIMLTFAKGGWLGTGLPDTGMYTLGAMGPPAFMKGGVTYPTHFAILDGILNGDFAFAYSGFIHLIMPAAVLSIWTSGALIRFMRNEMLDNVVEPHVFAARARGLPEREVRKRYIRRNSYIPFVTVIGPLYSGLIGWAAVTELIFGYQGLGYFMILSAYSISLNTLAICLLILGMTVITMNFMIDVIYAFLDPRIRY